MWSCAAPWFCSLPHFGGIAGSWREPSTGFRALCWAAARLLCDLNALGVSQNVATLLA
eukprot:m.267723 g.267723  ORF g.267723 m.267723 type:complete len:58 (-) comp11071_c1_seq4:34-207(-)